MKFALFMLTEYTKMIVVSVIAATLFLGGYDIPFVENEGWFGPIALFAKVLILLFGMIWVRATLPRFRYDRLMAFGWKIMLPVALFSVFLTAALVQWLPFLTP
jgi:NADH-quinone oxidoreductase subunit H